MAAQEERAPESVAGPPGPYGLLHRIPRAAPYLELARVEKPIGAPSLAPPVQSNPATRSNFSLNASADGRLDVTVLAGSVEHLPRG